MNAATPSDRPTLTVVAPCYNEAAAIEAFSRQVRDVLDGLPLRNFGHQVALSTGLEVVATAAGFYWLINRLSDVEIIPGAAVFIGLIGEYLSRIFEQTKDRPLYVLKQRPPGAIVAGIERSWNAIHVSAS